MLKTKYLCAVILVFLLVSPLHAAPVVVIPGDQGNNVFLATTNTVTETTTLTVGAIDVFLATPLPVGWLECDGATVNRSDYPDLVTYLAGAAAPTATLPDLRGEFVRGWDHGRGLDAGRALMTVQANQMLSHTHAASAAAAGSHTHTGATDPGGSHTHIISVVNPPGTTGTYFGSGGGGDRKIPAADTYGAGAHSHTGSLAWAGDHSHTVAISASGGAEFRPRNLSVIFAIRAKN